MKKQTKFLGGKDQVHPGVPEQGHHRVPEIDFTNQIFIQGGFFLAKVNWLKGIQI